MIPLVLFEDSQVDRLYPLTYTRAACELRVGALTLLERLRGHLGQPIAAIMVRPGLADVVRRRMPDVLINPPLSTKEGLFLVNARCLHLASSPPWQTRNPDSVGLSQNTIVWMHLSPELAAEVDLSKLHAAHTLEKLLPRVRRESSTAPLIGHPWDLLAHHRAAIADDFATLGAANLAIVMPGAHLLNPSQIHLAAGAKVWPGAVLDAQNGPIIVQAGAEIRAHAVITGPVVIGEHCVVRNMADIREETTLGPGCRVGGEIIGTIFQGNANKQHHGFLGQSIIGEWVNLGAGTTTSNVKNTYGTVKLPINGIDETTGRQFMGSVIGDHAKLGIGTYLSTGSVVGFGSHIVVPRPPRFVPSFAWLTDKGLARADFEKLEQIATIVLGRRHVEFTPADHALFVCIASEYAQAEQYDWPDTKRPA